MKLFREVLLVFGIAYVGDFISHIGHLPLPGSLVGMLILLLLLQLRVVRLEHVSAVSDFLLGHLPFFFIPAGVALMAIFPTIQSIWPLIIILCVITTILTMGLSGWSIQLLMKGKETHEHVD